MLEAGPSQRVGVMPTEMFIPKEQCPLAKKRDQSATLFLPLLQSLAIRRAGVRRHDDPLYHSTRWKGWKGKRIRHPAAPESHLDKLEIYLEVFLLVWLHLYLSNQKHLLIKVNKSITYKKLQSIALNSEFLYLQGHLEVTDNPIYHTT